MRKLTDFIEYAREAIKKDPEFIGFRGYLLRSFTGQANGWKKGYAEDLNEAGFEINPDLEELYSDDAPNLFSEQPYLLTNIDPELLHQFLTSRDIPKMKSYGGKDVLSTKYLGKSDKAFFEILINHSPNQDKPLDAGRIKNIPGEDLKRLGELFGSRGELDQEVDELNFYTRIWYDVGRSNPREIIDPVLTRLGKSSPIRSHFNFLAQALRISGGHARYAGECVNLLDFVIDQGVSAVLTNKYGTNALIHMID